MPLRSTMRGTVERSNTMLSKNNLQRSSATQPAPIRRSDSARIETWRDEVNVCCSPTPTSAGGAAGSNSSASSTSSPKLSFSSSTSSSTFYSGPSLQQNRRSREYTTNNNNDDNRERGALSRVTSKVFRRCNSETPTGGGRKGMRTSMYDGTQPSERFPDHWEDGAGESMYAGSIGVSEGGRLVRVADDLEMINNRGCGEQGNKLINEKELEGVRQAMA